MTNSKILELLQENRATQARMLVLLEAIVNATDQKHLDDTVAQIKTLMDKWAADKAGGAEPAANLSGVDGLLSQAQSLDATFSAGAPAPATASPSGAVGVGTPAVAEGTPMPAEAPQLDANGNPIAAPAPPA